MSSSTSPTPGTLAWRKLAQEEALDPARYSADEQHAMIYGTAERVYRLNSES